MTSVPSLIRMMQAGWSSRSRPRPAATAADLGAPTEARPAPVETVALLRWAPDLAGVAILADGYGRPNCPRKAVLAGPEVLLATAIHAKLTHRQAGARMRSL